MSSHSKEEPDTRYVHCVLDGYLECAAKVPVACICNKFPRHIYLERLKRKYGPADEGNE